MGQLQTEHAPCCMQEEEPLPAWKTYKRRMKDKYSREKKKTAPPETESESSSSTNTLQTDRKKEEDGR